MQHRETTRRKGDRRQKRGEAHHGHPPPMALWRSISQPSLVATEPHAEPYAVQAGRTRGTEELRRRNETASFARNICGRDRRGHPQPAVNTDKCFIPCANNIEDVLTRQGHGALRGGAGAELRGGPPRGAQITTATMQFGLDCFQQWNEPSRRRSAAASNSICATLSNSTRGPHEHACELLKRIGPRRSKQKRTGGPRLRTPTASGRKNTNLPAYDDKDHMEYEASSCFKHSGSDTQGRTTRWRRTNGGRSADTTMLIFYSDDASHHVPKRHYPPRSIIQDGHANHRRPAVEARESTAIQPWRHARQPTPQRTRP